MVEKAVGNVAAGLGHLARWARSVVPVIPGVAAPVVALYGIWQIYQPAAWIVAGLVLYAVDRRQ